MDFHRLLRIIVTSSATSSLLRPFHALLIVTGEYPKDPFLSTKLINLYSRLGDTRSSLLTFHRIPIKTVFTWNTLISTYIHNNLYSIGIRCFQNLIADVRPDGFTFPAVIKACLDVSDGRKMQSWIIKLGLGVDLYVVASLVKMYSRLGFIDDASKLFDEISIRDLGCWNAMVSGFSQNGDVDRALSLFVEMMVRGGVGIDAVTLTSILPACTQSQDHHVGLLIHALSIKHGLDFEIYVSNSLIDMYSKFDRVEDAHYLFDEMVRKDLVSWNSIISAYDQLGQSMVVLNLFEEMKSTGFRPDAFTLMSLASSISQAGNLGDARSIHGFVLRKGWDSGSHVFLSNAIVDMYGKLGKPDYSQRSFDRMIFRDLVSWNTLINCYSQNGLASEAIHVFQTMQDGSSGMVPNQGTLVGILPAYSCIGAVQQGMQIHGRSLKMGLDMDLFVGTCIIDMYAKCGRLTDADLLFEHMPLKSSISWNTIIAGHGIHGDGVMALNLFDRMREQDVKPDEVTFLSVLSACSHSGQVEEGKNWFRSMRLDYKLQPIMKHYACMVDMLGRKGDLMGAHEFIKSMPVEPDAAVWGALLGACRIYGDVELGKIASNRLFAVDPYNVGYYVLLSNIYARAGDWGEVDEVRKLVKDQRLKKTPGWSSIEVGNKVDVFFSGSHSHSQCRKIYEELGVLMSRIKTLGFIPDLSCVLQDVEEDEKDDILSGHSERLAIAFGLISTKPGTTLRIFKNLRVCVDCHNASKLISRVTEREIIVRDSSRFHHFKDSVCSCGDYW
ncbi:Pentatricopeptide repeat-containing protein [Zostera marina]|uniref:Pentatricopeptide repeat-containing protein n=1 Tax=Zostera marina TaxID=29655 RepID=A0A0K9NY99_ZOSMR|nr:Pentatricopeptide repeat-containing protein [Zostera marina]